MTEIQMSVKIPEGAELTSEVTFPTKLLPEWLQKTIKDHSSSYGTPEELWAVAFLSGLAAAAGKRIKITNGNYENYPQLWVMIVGASGTGKSEAGRVAFRRLLSIDAERYANYQMEYQEWETNDKQGAQPRWKKILTNDNTPEALFGDLAYAEDGLTLYRDELSGWFADFGRYNKSGEVGHYLSIFDNQTFSISRKKDPPQLIAEPFLNIFGTIQPGVLSEVLEKNNMEQSGFAQRFLFLYPEFPQRKYQRSTVTPSSESYNEVIEKIVEYSGKDEMFLSDGAEDAYEEFFNEMEENRIRATDFWAAAYSKAQIQVLRLALTVKIARLVYEPDTEVSVLDMKASIGMMRYFLQSLKKFKSEVKEQKGKKATILQIFHENPEANQSEVARMLGVSQPYVSTVLSSYRL